MYRYISQSAFLSLSFSLYLSQCPGILSVICMYLNKRDQLAAQRVVALKKNHFFLFKFACIRTTLDWYFFLSLSRWMSVPVFGYILTHCMSIYVSGLCFCHFSLNICSSDRLYYHSLYVSMSVAWSVFVSLSLTLSMPIAVFYRNLSWSAYPSSVFLLLLLCVRVYYR